MMKTFLLIIALMSSGMVQADILVIVNAKNSVAALERKQIVDLFMGRISAYPDQQRAQTLDLKTGTPLRADFYKRLTGKNEAQVDAYWATLIFAGRMSPPKQLPNEKKLIAEVASNVEAIAYVTRQVLPKDVKIVMELPAQE